MDVSLRGGSYWSSSRSSWFFCEFVDANLTFFVLVTTDSLKSPQEEPMTHLLRFSECNNMKIAIFHSSSTRSVHQLFQFHVSILARIRDNQIIVS